MVRASPGQAERTLGGSRSDAGAWSGIATSWSGGCSTARWDRLIPGVELAVIPGADHFRAWRDGGSVRRRRSWTSYCGTAEAPNRPDLLGGNPVARRPNTMRSSPRPRALLVDLDGVIRHWGGQGDPEIERETGLPPGAIREAAFSADLLLPAITGRVSDEEWRRQIADRLAAEFPAADAARAIARWSEPPGEIDDAVLALLERCREHATIVLVTNATSRLDRDLAQARDRRRVRRHRQLVRGRSPQTRAGDLRRRPRRRRRAGRSGLLRRRQGGVRRRGGDGRRSRATVSATSRRCATP